MLDEFENIGVKEIVRGNSKFRLQRDLIVQHENEQDEVLDYWRIVVPEHAGIREKIIRECHSIPYCAHPGVQRTLSRVRKSFAWKGMSTDVRAFIEKCPTCQIEKSDHVLRRGHLQSLAIPQANWKNVSIDFITDLPKSRNGEDSIMVVVDRATKMVHLVLRPPGVVPQRPRQPQWGKNIHCAMRYNYTTTMFIIYMKMYQTTIAQCLG